LEGYNDGGNVKLCGAIDVNSQFTKASPPPTYHVQQVGKFMRSRGSSG
jgi:hypothetical protein